METAPKDGSFIEVLTKADEFEADGKIITRKPTWFPVYWNPEGTSWVNDTLEVTGTWDTAEDGWLQPDEVTHWRPRDHRKVVK